MIEYVKGELAELSPTYAVVDVNGVGYGLHITLNTYSAVQGKANARLWVHENIREDAYLLFGFATKQEREAFLLLITVSGIGANTARMILSELTAAELCNVIMTDNVRALTSVKGIGQRTAQRLILELKDKIVALGVEPEQVAASSTAAPDPVNKEVRDGAVGALTMLGFAPAPSAKVVTAILTEQPSLPVEQVVKLALKQIK